MSGGLPFTSQDGGKLRRAAKTDESHAAIRNHLRAIGWCVFDTSAVGRNFGDLVVSRGGFTAIVECKPKSDRSPEVQLTEGQREFRNWWQGAYVVACTPEQAADELAARYLGFRLEALRIEEAGVDE